MYRISYAEYKDIDSWMNLVEQVSWNFPGLETKKGFDDYRTTLLRNIERKTAICAKHKDQVIGVLLFSKNKKQIGCMAVKEDYRRKGIGEALISKMLESFNIGDEIKVSTFLEDDEKGKAPRALYKKLGFIEGDLCMEFGYPNQIFKLVL